MQPWDDHALLTEINYKVTSLLHYFGDGCMVAERSWLRSSGHSRDLFLQILPVAGIDTYGTRGCHVYLWLERIN